MFAILAAAVETTAATAEAVQTSGGAAELIHRFGIQGNYVVMQFISFAILGSTLYWFGIKPVLLAMDERTGKIEAGLANEKASIAKLAETQKQVAAQIKVAQVEANKIVDEARKAAKELSEREAAAATERANGLIAKAQQAIELEHKKMLADAQKEIARLVVATTERVLAKKLTDADRSSYNEAAARELTSV
ncbi:MAG: ATP synthase F0 subunit B [Verrucomicrobia bacterium]|nr:MAG: ATP synthase F0 subunit B [Verrucomicrobiota bacterium]